MKLYAKIKVNGKWTMVPAGSVATRVEAHERCQCNVCRPPSADRCEVCHETLWFCFCDINEEE